MTGQIGAVLVERGKPFLREEALQGERGVQGGGAVALGQSEPVTTFPTRIVDTNLHLFAVEYGEHVRDGQRAADVSGAEDGDLLDGLLAYLTGETLEFHESFAWNVRHDH